MNTLLACAMGQASKGNRKKVFDWDSAAQYCKNKNIDIASAGLFEDLEWTAGVIVNNGKPYLKSYTYLASTWATPVLIIPASTIDSDNLIIECWKWEDECDWDSNTKWPQSALKIMGELNE